MNTLAHLLLLAFYVATIALCVFYLVIPSLQWCMERFTEAPQPKRD